ncbi:MAG TPA: glycosyltransferase [Thermoanaerobaculia bacterium]|nr:glycosyltransferase [Thermoanaerobaculia bacterium]
MRRTKLRGEPEVSVVIPIVERVGDLRQLHDEFAAELERLGKTCEFIFVVDDSQRGSLPVLRELQGLAGNEILIIVLGGAFGESAALTLGLERARGDIILTLASYFQVDPRGLASAFEELDAGADLVAGRRHPRIDSFFNRVQSRLFHSFVGRLTGTRFSDISCGFKLMRRRVAQELNLYGGLHRFIPLLALSRGFSVREVPLPQRDEDRGTRYYGTGVYLGRLLDILTVFFLTKFTRTPLRFFGLLGSALFALGFLLDLIAVVQKAVLDQGIADRPILLLGVLLMVLGVQTLSLGLVGEIIIFTHARNVREYQVAEVIRGSAPRAIEPARPVAVPSPPIPVDKAAAF